MKVNGDYRATQGSEEYSKADTCERAEREKSRSGYVLLASQGHLRLSRRLSGGKTHQQVAFTQTLGLLRAQSDGTPQCWLTPSSRL